MMIIRAVTFDLDDTLWCADEVLSNATGLFHNHIEVHFPKIAQKYSEKDFSALMCELRNEYPEYKHNYTFLRKEALRICAKDCGYSPNEVLESAYPAFIIPRSTPTISNDVFKALKLLKSKGYAMGAITNGNFDIDYVPQLKSYFSFCVSAEQCRAAKPKADPFKLAMENFLLKGHDLNPEEIVHCGDDLQCDVTGAKSFGMRAIWVNENPPIIDSRHSISISSLDATVVPDAIVSHISQISDILDNWNLAAGYSTKSQSKDH